MMCFLLRPMLLFLDYPGCWEFNPKLGAKEPYFLVDIRMHVVNRNTGGMPCEEYYLSVYRKNYPLSLMLLQELQEEIRATSRNRR